MPIDFTCPHCYKRLRVPDESAGMKAKCPACGAVVALTRTAANDDAGVVNYDVNAERPPDQPFRFRPPEEKEEKEEENDEPEGRPRKRKKKDKAFYCGSCNVEVPPGMTVCVLCGRNADDPDSPAARKRELKEVDKYVDKMRFYRLDLCAGQGVAILLGGALMLCCGILFPIAVILSVVVSIGFGAFLVHYVTSPPEGAKSATLERWRYDTMVCLVQLIVSALISLGMIVMLIAILFG